MIPADLNFPIKGSRSFQGSTSRLLLITNKLHDSSAGGRELLCKLNHDALQDIYGERFVLFELPRRPLQGIRVLKRLRGIYCCQSGLTDSGTNKVIKNKKNY